MIRTVQVPIKKEFDAFFLLATLLVKAETLKITALLSKIYSGWLRPMKGKRGAAHTGTDIGRNVPALVLLTNGHGNMNKSLSFAKVNFIFYKVRMRYGLSISEGCYQRIQVVYYMLSNWYVITPSVEQMLKQRHFKKKICKRKSEEPGQFLSFPL